MGSFSNIPDPRALRIVDRDVIVDGKGFSTDIFNRFQTNLIRNLIAISRVNVVSFGARGDGRADSTLAFQQAIQQTIKNGGGVIFVPSGNYRISSVIIPSTAPPIWFQGEGWSTTITLLGNIAQNVGMFDVSASNFAMSDLVLDGNKTVSTPLLYNVDFVTANGNDPLAPALTQNTSVWLHGPLSNFLFDRVKFTHAAGYSVIVDCTTGSIADGEFYGCWFQNNRATTFGVTAGQAIYGSWNGGVLVQGDGRTAVSGIAERIIFADNRLERNTGNCFWQHSYGLTRLHSMISVTGNMFLDCGLDAILMGAVTGGVVSNNVMRRVGYVCSDDNSQSIPRWLVGLNATGIDSSGLVKGINYEDNSLTSVNGGMIDADGHCDSSISGNICRIPVLGEAEYDEDSIAITGPTNSGNASYGINFGNSSQTPWGAKNVAIVGNTMLNLPSGSIRLYAARFCMAQGNVINAPDASINPPIAMGPLGPGPFQRCYSNRVSANHTSYSPGTPSTPLAKEDDSISAFTGGEINYVFSNNPIIGNGNAIEFVKSPTSGSTVWPTTIWS